jgi:hypothetical protein
MRPVWGANGRGQFGAGRRLEWERDLQPLLGVGLLEVLLDKAHGHTAFSHSCRDPLDRAGPHIADHEYAGQAGLE